MELTLEEAALAWAQGKRVECLTNNQTEYLPISRVGTSDGIISPTCFGDRDDDRIRYKFRLAPEPPVKKFRPWTPEEVPVGAVLRNKCVDAYRALIIGVNDDGRLVYSLNQADQSVMGDDLESALKYRLVSLDPVGTPDNKRTWLPCGSEVDA